MSKASEERRQQNRIQRENEFMHAVTKELRKMHSLGMERGAYAISRAVLGMIEDNKDDTPENVLRLIEAFCHTAEDPDKKVKEEQKEDGQNADHSTEGNPPEADELDGGVAEPATD